MVRIKEKRVRERGELGLGRCENIKVKKARLGRWNSAG